MDIYSTQNQTELVKLMAETILGTLDGYSEKIMSRISMFFKSCRPVFSMDAYSGVPQVSLDIQPQASSHSLMEIMEYMKASGHECFVAIDEFQQILEYPEEGIEALLRSVAQFAPNVHFVYAGSKQHLMSGIFSSQKRPFYQCTQKMGLDTLDKDVYCQFAQRLMQEGGKDLPKEVFDAVYELAHGFTYYVQDIMNRLYAQKDSSITMAHYHRVVKDITDEGETVYKDYCDLLARGQLKVLYALAKEDMVLKPFDAAFMQKHHLSALSSVKLALSALVKNGIVSKSPNGYFIYDRYLSIWLNRHK